jgi:hydroxymethylpyrimidine kinase/phosphomethylpyrimidine kinase
MFASAETIEVVAKSLQEHDVKTLVIDPVWTFSQKYHEHIWHAQVMVSTTGSQLLPEKAVRELRTHLLPHATILTPNVPEAQLLLSDAGKPAEDPKNVDDLIEIAKSVQSLGPKYVLVKGGHLPFKKDGNVAKTDEERELMIDILYGEGAVTRIETAYQRSKNTHGTGCSLACE